MAGIRFEETMDGFLGENIRNFSDGEDYGIRHNNPVKFDVRITIDSVDDFIQVSSHEAKLTGKFYCTSIGGDKGMTMRGGRFNLFDVNPESGHRNMRYRFTFTAPDGKEYYFAGFKDIFNDKVFDIIDDLTTLFVRIYEGKDELGELYGSGVMYFRVRDMASIMQMI